MPPRNRRPQTKKKKKQPRQPPMFGPANKPKPRKKRAKAAGAGSAAVQKYAQMIANPFTSQLHHGMFGEVATGMSQFKKSYAFGSGTSGTTYNSAGYILWWPAGNASGYSSSENSVRDQPVGVMMYKSTGSANAVPNTAAQKMFANEYATWANGPALTAAASTTSVDTPDNAFLSSVASRSKLLSAGMVLRCTSTPLILQGEYIKIDGLPINQLLEPATAVQALTVDRLFDLSAHEPKPFMAGQVVRHIYINDRHNSGLATSTADETTDNSDASTVNAGAGNSKTCLAVIEKGSSTATLPTSYDEAHAPKLFGFAFRGVNPAMLEQMYVDCYVNKEYIVAPIQGIPNRVTGRTGPDVSEAAHLLATMKINAFNAAENGVKELTKGLVGRGVKYLGSEVLGLI